MAANRTLLLPLPTPVDTLRALLALAGTASFWRAAGLSLLRVCAGFALAALAGTLCAAASVRWRAFRWLTGPLVGLIRAMPVAVFTIVVFLWVGRGYIPSTIVFLTVLPIVWSGMETGLRQLDPQLAEMARVFGMTRWDTLRHITLPQLRPYAGTAVVTGLGRRGHLPHAGLAGRPAVGRQGHHQLRSGFRAGGGDRAVQRPAAIRRAGPDTEGGRP